VCVRFLTLSYPARKSLFFPRRIRLPSVTRPAVQYFSTLSHKRRDSRGKKLLHIKCVFWFSLQICSETFLILRRIQRDIIKNYTALRVQYALLLSYINRTWNTVDRLSKNTPNYQTSLQPSSGSRVVQRGQTDRQTDTYDKANIQFPSFPQTRTKILT